MVTYSPSTPTPEYRRLLDILPPDDGRWLTQESRDYDPDFKSRLVTGLLEMSPRNRSLVLGLMRAAAPGLRKIAGRIHG